MSQELTEEQDERITQAIFAGDRSEAISLYISIKGCGLTEAQEFIKTLTAELQETKPQHFTGKHQKKRVVWDRLIFRVKK